MSYWEDELARLKSSNGKAADPLAPLLRQGAGFMEQAAKALLEAALRTTKDRRGFDLVGPVFKHVVIKDPR